MAETLTNTTNEKGNDNNLVSSVKKAAAILVAALGLTVATSQDVNAQLMTMNFDKANKETAARIEKRKNESAKLDNTIAAEKKKTKEIFDGNDERRAEIAELKKRLEGKKGK